MSAVGESTDANTNNGAPESSRLIGESQAMAAVRSLIARVAVADNASVLILGQSGTGKELVAREIHERSRRADKPFVPLNCGAMSLPSCWRASCSVTRKAPLPVP